MSGLGVRAQNIDVSLGHYECVSLCILYVYMLFVLFSCCLGPDGVSKGACPFLLIDPALCRNLMKKIGHGVCLVWRSKTS